MIPADNPIKTKAQDELGRAKVAGTLAREIRLLDASEGCVVGILGPRQVGGIARGENSNSHGLSATESRRCSSNVRVPLRVLSHVVWRCSVPSVVCSSVSRM